MSWETIREILAILLLLLGALMSLSAGVGLIRFPDLLARLHAATKPQVLGLVSVAAAVILLYPSPQTIGIFALVLVFQLMTAPLSAHLIGRAEHRRADAPPDSVRIDELARDLPNHGNEGGIQR